MATITFTLTSTELACGVTLEDVARELPRVMIRDNGATLIVDGTLPSMLCEAVARCSFGTRDFTGPEIDHDLGLAIYRAASIYA